MLCVCVCIMYACVCVWYCKQYKFVKSFCLFVNILEKLYSTQLISMQTKFVIHSICCLCVL